ncbi:hypothetical protein [Nostoc sp.]
MPHAPAQCPVFMNKTKNRVNYPVSDNIKILSFFRSIAAVIDVNLR